MRFRGALLAAFALPALIAGCVAVAPYQRGYLARPDMALDNVAGTAKALEKTFASKEAASGGASVGGGGCGCN
ncbi:MAG TPA: DUF4266 domain-containing protein [Usitatibacter sp.]|nr:DUF4266 domain-containing protein [Usitatibacter sp.]